MPVAKKQARRRVKSKKSEGGLLSKVTPFESRGELKMSIYGKSATGKTTLWSSFPGPILAILCSGGQGTNELDSVSPEDREKIEPFYLQSCDQLMTLAEELKTDTYYKTVVVDHLTGVQDLRLAELLGLDEIPTQKSWGLADRQQYGQRAQNMKDYLRAYLDLVDKKVVLVSQEKTVEVDEESELDILPTVGPSLSSSVLSWLNPASNYIARTFISPKTEQRKKKGIGGKIKTVTERVKGEYNYCLWTGPSDIYTTKFRVPKEFHKPEFIVDPSYEKVEAVINGTYKEQ